MIEEISKKELDILKALNVVEFNGYISSTIIDLQARLKLLPNEADYYYINKLSTVTCYIDYYRLK